MTNTKRLRKFYGYTQEQLAKLLGVSRSTVAMWETTQQEPDYEVICKIAQIFNVPADYVMGRGIFSKWEQILEYYPDVSFRLMNLIPRDFEMPSFSDEKTLIAWLDTRLYNEPDEMQLARWFAFAVKDIVITPKGYNENKEKYADVEIEFTSEFKKLIENHRNSISCAPSNDVRNIGELLARQGYLIPSTEDKRKPEHVNIIKIAGRDGSFQERKLTDEQLAALKAIVEQMPEVPDDL